MHFTLHTIHYKILALFIGGSGAYILSGMTSDLQAGFDDD